MIDTLPPPEWANWRVGKAFMELVFQHSALANDFADKLEYVMLAMAGTMEPEDKDRLSEITGYRFSGGLQR